METSAVSCLSMIMAAKYETFNCVTRLEQEDEEQEEDEEVLELTSPVFLDSSGKKTPPYLQITYSINTGMIQ